MDGSHDQALAIPEHALSPAVKLPRDLCGDLSAASSREWLVTNGLGGFASGTVSGALTRRYHGLLVAALDPPLGRTLLCSKVDEVATTLGQRFSLGCNFWESGHTSPEGRRFLESFFLEGLTPTWRFALGDALLQKRVFLRRGENTTYVCYELVRGRAPLELHIAVLVNYRDYHGETHDGAQYEIEPLDGQKASVPSGLRVTAFPSAQRLYVLAKGAAVRPKNVWYRDFTLPAEKARGFSGHEDHLCAGEIRRILEPGERFCLVLSAEPDAAERVELDGHKVFLAQLEDEARRIRQAGADDEPPEVKQLILAADQFLVARPNKTSKQQERPQKDAADDGCTIIAGYPWFSDWGRDTMVSLAGLTLCTGQPQQARRILCTFARHLDKGLLPNRFPDDSERPEYNTADATLLFFEALRAYHEATGDDALIAELWPRLVEIVDWHERGTHHGIHIDRDGLVQAAADGVQLTWMDAKVNGWVVTPRRGKPVEINALWHNALCVLARFARRFGTPADLSRCEALLARVKQAFLRFYNPATGYLFDVIDGPQGERFPDGNDPSLRPNQIFCVSLPHSPLSHAQQKAVVDACARSLYTSYGLRSLAPSEPGYKGRYDGDVLQRDAAYHEGTVWGFLLGPFALAHYRVYGDLETARSYLRPMLEHLSGYGLGTLGEIFDGDPPHLPRGCIAQAWTVAEWLRAYKALKSPQKIDR